MMNELCKQAAKGCAREVEHSGSAFQHLPCDVLKEIEREADRGGDTVDV
jgi:hypothetical protein